MSWPSCYKPFTFWGSLFFYFGATMVMVIGVVEYPLKTGLVLSIVIPPYIFLDWYVQKRLLIPPTYNIPFVGLKGAGKTALVYRLCRKLYLYLPRDHYIETLSPCPFEFSYGDFASGRAMEIKSSDVGGRFWQRLNRRVFEYINHGAIFVIDASNRSKFEDARYMLENLIKGGIIGPGIGTRPILILATKSDKTGSVKANDIKSILNLRHLRHGGVPREKVRLVMSGYHSQNAECPFSWLNDDLINVILQFTGDGRQPERIISDPYMCNAFVEYSNPKGSDDLADGLVWLMNQLQSPSQINKGENNCSENNNNDNNNSEWWREWKILRWARIYFWKPERASYNQREDEQLVP